MEEHKDDKNPDCQEKLAENELYTEVEEDERINKETHNKEESDNPLYESATSEVEFNPIYTWQTRFNALFPHQNRVIL